MGKHNGSFVGSSAGVAPAPGSINNHSVLKATILNILEPISNILKKVFSSGIFSNMLKHSIVTPCFKKGDKSDINNFRPISVNTNISKIFEKAIANRLNNFINKFSIICKEQNGFVEGGSTTNAIFDVTNKLYNAWDKKEPTVALLLDLSKAFDCVSHWRLIEKLELYGIRGITLDLFKSYLTDRVQQVQIKCKDKYGKINVYKSQGQIVSRGVPQGSILGPILFILYVNDFSTSISDKCYQFADDICIIAEMKTFCELTHKLNNILLLVSNWFEKNELVMNVAKTQVFRVGNYDNTNQNIFLNNNNNSALSLQASVKFLGILLDNKMTYKNHISIVLNKLGKSYYILCNLKHILCRETLLITYHSYVESHLTYGIIFWGNSTNFIDVFKRQKKIVRIIAGVHPRHSCRLLFKDLNILTAYSIFILNCILFYKKNEHYFSKRNTIHYHNTRNRDNINFKNSNLHITLNSPYNIIVKICNKLPYHILNLKYNKLKSVLKNILLNKVIYSLEEYYSINFNEF